MAWLERCECGSKVQGVELEKNDFSFKSSQKHRYNLRACRPRLDSVHRSKKVCLGCSSHCNFLATTLSIRELRLKKRNNRKQRECKGKQKVCDMRGELESTNETGCEDIITEILHRLPWGDVARFKVVSSNWLRLISGPTFRCGYLATNLFLLGLTYEQSGVGRFIPLRAALDCYPGHCHMVQKHVEAPKDLGLNEKDLTLCFCNGISLHIQRRIPCLFYSLHDPVSGQSVYLPKPPSIFMQTVKVLGYGLALDLSSSDTSQLTIVELVKVVPGLQVNTFSSKTWKWQTKVHNVPYLDRKPFMSSQGIYLNGFLYWLSVPNGVVVYDVHHESFVLDLMDVPGETVHVSCFCRIARSMGSAFHEHSSRMYMYPCMCRYLGQSQKCVFYIRFDDYFEISMWSLDTGKWSPKKSIFLRSMPVSLDCGRILTIDPQDSRTLYIRLKNRIYLCNLELNVLKEVQTLRFKAKEGWARISPILPCEASRIPHSLSLQSCFRDLLGISLCHKDTCWLDASAKYKIRIDAHLHQDSLAECSPFEAMFSDEQTRWLKSNSLEDDRMFFDQFWKESEYVTIKNDQ